MIQNDKAEIQHAAITITAQTIYKMTTWKLLKNPEDFMKTI